MHSRLSPNIITPPRLFRLQVKRHLGTLREGAQQVQHAEQLLGQLLGWGLECGNLHAIIRLPLATVEEQVGGWRGGVGGWFCVVLGTVEEQVCAWVCGCVGGWGCVCACLCGFCGDVWVWVRVVLSEWVGSCVWVGVRVERGRGDSMQVQGAYRMCWAVDVRLQSAPGSMFSACSGERRFLHLARCHASLASYAPSYPVEPPYALQVATAWLAAQAPAYPQCGLILALLYLLRGRTPEALLAYAQHCPAGAVAGRCAMLRVLCTVGMIVTAVANGVVACMLHAACEGGVYFSFLALYLLPFPCQLLFSPSLYPPPLCNPAPPSAQPSCMRRRGGGQRGGGAAGAAAPGGQRAAQRAACARPSPGAGARAAPC